MDLKPLNHTVEMESEIFLLFFLKSSTFQTFYNQKLRIHRFWSAKNQSKSRQREESDLSCHHVSKRASIEDFTIMERGAFSIGV